MKNINFNSLLLFFICLYLGGCDFADDKLRFENLTDENIIVVTTYFQSSGSKGIDCTRNLVEAKSTRVLELLNRKWSDYFNNELQRGYLEVIVVKAPISEISPDEHFHEYLESKLKNSTYSKSKLNFEELNIIDWKLVFPSIR